MLKNTVFLIAMTCLISCGSSSESLSEDSDNIHLDAEVCTEGEARSTVLFVRNNNDFEWKDVDLRLAKGGKNYLLGLAGMHVTDSRIDTFDLPPQSTTLAPPFKDATKFTGRGEGIRKDSTHGAPLIRLSNFSNIESATIKLGIPGQPTWAGPVTKCN